MASNGLTSNPNKTALVFLNVKKSELRINELKIRKELIVQEKNAKLLGITFDDNQEWNSHIHGI